MVEKSLATCYAIKRREIIKSRDVVFHDDQFFANVEKNDKSKEEVAGVVGLNLILLQCRLQIENVCKMLRTLMRHRGCQVKRVLSRRSSLLSQNPQNLKLGGLLESINHQLSILHLI